MADARTIDVWADWEARGLPARVGELRAIASRGKQIFAFEYDATWLAARSVAFDPELRPMLADLRRGR